MKKLNNKKGFTLAELLIVIAIIAALVAIMIPTFSGQVEKAKEAADVANLRAGYAEATTKYLNDGKADQKVKVNFTQTKADWQNTELIGSLPFDFGTDAKPSGTAGEVEVTFTFSDSGKPVASW